jgi:hypothetical protein
MTRAQAIDHRVVTGASATPGLRLYEHNREDVRRKLTKLLEQADQGIPVAAESWTVGKYLEY